MQEKIKGKLKTGSIQCPGGVENQMIVMTLQHFKLTKPIAQIGRKLAV
jgi:hypothetical protein